MNTISGVILGHRRTFAAALLGVAAYYLLPDHISLRARGIIAWDIGATAMLALCAQLFAGASPDSMQANAAAQEDGEWTLFWLVVAAASVSFAAIVSEFGSMKNAAPALREAKVALVAGTLALSWLLTHTVFALRYAHEFYSRADGAAAFDEGLQFPSEPCPDYWDFFYFSAILGMTFQVSDVQITSRKLRRLATVHGMLGFVFNTVIVALTVNLASGLLS